MALDHHADQRTITLQALFKYILEHGRLVQRVFAAVGVTAIDHDTSRNPESGQVAVHLGNAGAVVVRPAMATAQYQVSVRIALSLNDRRMSLAIDTEMAMGMSRGAHGVAGDTDTTVSPVLEPYRHAQAAGHFPMDLRLRGPGANCLLYTSPSPRDGLLSRMPSSA